MLPVEHADDTARGERRVGRRQVEGLADQAGLDLRQVQQRAGRLLDVAHRALLRQPQAFQAADAGGLEAVERIGATAPSRRGRPRGGRQDRARSGFIARPPSGRRACPGCRPAPCPWLARWLAPRACRLSLNGRICSSPSLPPTKANSTSAATGLPSSPNCGNCFGISSAKAISCATSAGPSSVSLPLTGWLRDAAGGPRHHACAARWPPPSAAPRRWRG